MKKSKLLCALLALLMVFSMTLTACGSDDGAKNNEGKNTTTDSAGSTGKNEDDKGLSLGGYDSNVYTNYYIGLTCRLDENWTVYSADELQDLPDSVQDIYEGSDLGDAMDDYEQIFDMAAENATDLTSINIVYTKLKEAEKQLYWNMTQEETVDAILSQKDMLISAYTQAGVSVQELTKVQVQFMGQECYGIHMKATVQGIMLYTLQFPFFQEGDFSVTLTLSSYQLDKTEALMQLFAPID